MAGWASRRPTEITRNKNVVFLSSLSPTTLSLSLFYWISMGLKGKKKKSNGDKRAAKNEGKEKEKLHPG